MKLTRLSEPVSAMGPSGDRMSPELRDLVADTRDKSENKVIDVLSKLKGIMQVLSFATFTNVEFRLFKAVSFL